MYALQIIERKARAQRVLDAFKTHLTKAEQARGVALSFAVGLAAGIALSLWPFEYTDDLVEIEAKNSIEHLRRESLNG